LIYLADRVVWVRCPSATSARCAVDASYIALSGQPALPADNRQQLLPHVMPFRSMSLATHKTVKSIDTAQ